MTTAGDHEPPADLGRRAVRGAVVTVGAQGARILIQLTSVVVLSRLLNPEDYGLITMVLAVIGVADVFRDFGLSSAAIQSPTLSRAEQVNLFWINSALGLVLACLAAAGSPLVAFLYAQPLLGPITLALAVNFLLNGMATQYRADLNRRMLFTRLAVADVVAPLLGLVVAVALAANGVGYWALVAQQLTQVGVMLVLVIIGARWLPARWQRGTSVRRFMSFGWKLVGSQLLGYAGNNIDSIMIGLRMGEAPLGLYNRAYQLIMTPLGQIRGPLNSVAIPVLSRIQADEQRFQSYVARGQMVMGYSLVAGLFLIAGAADPLVAVALGEKWTPATDLLRLLAIGAGFQTLSYVGYWVYVSRGIVDHLLRYSVVSTVLRIVVVVGCSFFGLLGVAAAMAVLPLMLWPISIWWLSQRASIPVRQLWLGGVRISVFGAVVFAVTWLTSGATVATGSWGQLLAAVGAGVAAYTVMVLAIPVFRRDLRSVLELARNLRPQRG